MLGIIGGSGLYEIDDADAIEQRDVETPFGTPSAAITLLTKDGKQTAFLPRHGKQHEFLPSEVNYRANIWALKSQGVTKILSISAVGSLRDELPPSMLVIPDQYFDHTRGKRDYSFFGEGLSAHISTAEPHCEVLANDIISVMQSCSIDVEHGGTYACVEGPRLGTKAESHFLRNAAACDIVGMTNIPEAFLAREAQISYCTIGIVTDYDCWKEETDAHASVELVFENYAKNIGKVRRIVSGCLTHEFAQSPDMCRKSLHNAILTKEEDLTPRHKEILRVLLT